VPAASLMDEAMTLARELSLKAPIAMRLAMDVVRRGLDMSFADGCALEATLFGLTAATDDMREGTRAFLEKRKANFTGK
jgi:enoyl-CoA hydratase